MKIRLGIIAIVLFGLNLVSCSPNSLAEEDKLYEVATDGEKEHVNEQPDD